MVGKLRGEGAKTPLTALRRKQELQEVLKFPIEIFWNLEGI